MKVYQGLARAFAAEGTSAVFGMMGDANMHWLNALRLLDVAQYDVRHEGGGLAMADGWARLDGNPGVCTTTSGPGVAQLATTLIVAARARTPLVAFVGEGPLGDESYLQSLDQRRFAEACEAGFIRIESAQTALESVQHAFYRARTESRPIMLSAPMDVQQYELPDDDYFPSRELLHIEPAFPHPRAIEAAVDILVASRLPVIIVGRGAVHADASKAVLGLAQDIGALIATTLMAKSWLSDLDEYHAGISGLYSTRTAIELFQEADCVIAVGASLNHFTTEHGYLFPAVRYVHIDSKSAAMMGHGKTAEVYIHSDAASGTAELWAAVQRRDLRNEGFRTPKVKARLTAALDDSEVFDLEPGTLDPRQACRLLDDLLPADIGLVLGGGANIGFPTMLMTKPRRMLLANQHWGCIGQGLTTAIGAVIATGSRPALLIEGDAGLMMHLPEFETAVRYGLPLLVVVFNDQKLGAEYYKSMVKGLDTELTKISTPDLGAVGRALGGGGALATDLDQFRAAIEEYVRNPKPTMIDARISSTVVTIPYRRLHFGHDV